VIRQVTTDGRVSTIAGLPPAPQATYPPANCAFRDGRKASARFKAPAGIAYNAVNGDLYVTDTGNCVIRQVTATGGVTTIAGLPPAAHATPGPPANCGFADGTGRLVRFNSPSSIVYNASDGDLYVTDTGNCVIRRVTTTGNVKTIAGLPPAAHRSPGSNCGSADGTKKAARFNRPMGIAYDAENGDLYVADTGNCAIRQVTTTGHVRTVAGLANCASYGFVDGFGDAARFNFPSGITYDATGYLYVTDSGNYEIRLVQL